MKRFKTRFLALCGLMVLAGAAVAPFTVGAESCPSVTVICGGKSRTCTGTVNGDKCDYSKSCLTCGSSGYDDDGPAPEDPIQN